mmetsp:Transcript_63343/g.137856  ORF Transcript_63343/g.137856 Transcript_63343/m.137856 type:complete len:245 (+) Transcript_63343:143-877(+)|eukprot:CAMPEP_0170593546 /NCGR_PEP_ID=MMETSP0224-20130122/13508_1 /TAXON_ID=285029 /ORGANISM="Togula jolla, Strain CCCM 725" /LENGTH=244 /DNA_ID=CAMNT_0010917511 /DNA_START=142 /DNA_END=876 /DNA_ORIENTATION=-
MPSLVAKALRAVVFTLAGANALEEVLIHDLVTSTEGLDSSWNSGHVAEARRADVAKPRGWIVLFCAGGGDDQCEGNRASFEALGSCWAERLIAEPEEVVLVGFTTVDCGVDAEICRSSGASAQRPSAAHYAIHRGRVGHWQASAATGDLLTWVEQQLRMAGHRSKRSWSYCGGLLPETPDGVAEESSTLLARSALIGGVLAATALLNFGFWAAAAPEGPCTSTLPCRAGPSGPQAARVCGAILL